METDRAAGARAAAVFVRRDVQIAKNQTDLWDEHAAQWTEYHLLGSVSPREQEWPDPLRGQTFKRLFDVSASIAGLLFLSPVLLALALAIRLQDGGPVLFGHTRIGLHGKPFKCWKFRSMVVDAQARLETLLETDPDAAREWKQTRKLRKDPRITRLGQFLRKSSLDELPQLINVIRGQMSLVGPRPVVEDELAHYGIGAVHYLRVRPGITGPWQVSGRSDTDYETRVALDKDYTLTRSFWDDVRIVVMTVPAVLLSRGAI